MSINNFFSVFTHTIFVVKKDSKILDAIMNIIFVIIVVCILFPWLPGLLFYVFGFLALHVILY
ncbi:hypothetical protein ACQJ8E_00260 [Helicobacter pylori]